MARLLRRSLECNGLLTRLMVSLLLIPRDECEVGYHRERRDQREGEKGIDLGG